MTASMPFLTRRASLVAAAALALTPALTQAQAWPAKPIKITVAYPPGGVADSVARLLADRLAPVLGQSVLVDNKAGASGTIGMDAVAKAPPDGYSFGFSAISPLVLNPHLGKSPFDPARDIAPVVSVIASPVLLLGTSALPARDFKELVAAAKARPGAVRWATSGPASLGHIVLEQVKSGAGADMTHVPYKGGGQQINDALGGQFEVLSVNAGPAVMGHIKSGKLKPLAVGAPARLEELPAVPTLAEMGLPAANLASVFGLFAPAGTPPAVIERLNTEVNKLLKDKDVRQKIEAADNVPTGGSAADFARFIAAESASNARIIKAASIKAD
ncbi:tripartite tricarboxylate transporter substrate binding protein [Ottowia sp.]|uniref:Bug family tripartite tricarboxylate transporter substrate binding protein n=2 Tax=Ottowia sp. TaxID=1898956 RepID=UPI002C498A43|nr:tripartite tricarboxylate transporter substrate binding protein [Ottowia sp.]HPZ57497.1 tripartite tricarboxylate transporter substrate binding protein [Ottowia sp.]HQD48149.1 tripartite tricarboxylate transporter substrate binding protein [Ottowia sp.]